jgi:hypothetical protein
MAHGREFRAGLFEACTVAQPPKHHEAPRGQASLRQRGSVGDGHPHVPLGGKIEAIRHHANDSGRRPLIWTARPAISARLPSRLSQKR